MSIGCSFQVEVPSTWITVYLRFEVDGESPDYETFEGYSELGGSLWKNVRASVSDRQVRCWATWPGVGEAYREATLPGSGPGSVAVQVKSFIPYEWVVNPWNWTTVFEGDNRGFQPYGGSSRTLTLFEVLNPAVNNGNVLNEYHEAGMTIAYDRDTSLTSPPFGNITAEARNDWEPGYPLKVAWEFASTSGMDCSPPNRLGPNSSVPSSTHEFNCFGSAGNPLVLAPPIEWNLHFTFEYGLNKVRYTLDGCTGWFPAFEVYANGVNLLEHSSSEDPMDLFYGCGRSLSRSGEF